MPESKTNLHNVQEKTCNALHTVQSGRMKPNKEQTRKILQAIEECDRYIAKESPRAADLRPVEIQKLLEFYIAHRAKLAAMIS